MSLDERSINAVKEYFESITQNSIDIAYEAVKHDTTFAEFMEAVNQKLNQFSSELVASEVLHMSARRIENFNGGEGIGVDDIQDLIDSNEGADFDEDEDE